MSLLDANISSLQVTLADCCTAGGTSSCPIAARSIHFWKAGLSAAYCSMRLVRRHLHPADCWFVAIKPSDLDRAKIMLGLDPSEDLDIGALDEVGMFRLH
jgi:hypothetical protein